MIDLGLPSGTKWPCCNVGATAPEGYVGYYVWGETEEKSLYNEVTYQYATGKILMDGMTETGLIRIMALISPAHSTTWPT